MCNDRFLFNGINGADGEYLLPAMAPHDISRIAQGEKLDEKHINDLKRRHQEAAVDHLGVKEDVDPRILAQCGWGIIFANDADPAIKEALGELLAHRHTQASQKNERYYQEYVGAKGYRPGESKQQFLSRNGGAAGPVDPDKVPYYLLIAGDPEVIPYRFQYHLDVQYAVGRIHFDTLEQYAQYAHSVVEAETGQQSLPRRATFFGVRNNRDPVTRLTAEHLVKPLAEKMSRDLRGWEIQTILADNATKARLGKLLGGDETPALVFTASHGMGFPNGDPRQLPHQGALLCQEWPGRQHHQGSIPENFYFSADDVPDEAKLSGLVTFHFACYGGGTPRLDDFSHRAFGQPKAIAPHAFVARLPQRLLSHPNGGALAVVGHVERAWGYSFMWEKAGEQLTVFESSLKRLMGGYPIGSAMDYFNERYAELATDLNAALEDVKLGEIPNHLELARMWAANNDARSYVIIGDPAVRLAVG